jgi:hypothetical protein
VKAVTVTPSVVNVVTGEVVKASEVVVVVVAVEAELNEVDVTVVEANV